MPSVPGNQFNSGYAPINMAVYSEQTFMQFEEKHVYSVVFNIQQFYYGKPDKNEKGDVLNFKTADYITMF